MWGRKNVKDQMDGLKGAEDALAQSRYQSEVIQALKPEVEATVREHKKLQLENHFAERIWIAYRGDLK